MKTYSVALSLLFFAISAQAKDCTYQLDQDSAQIGWTAFKTTQKVGVNGSFKKFTLKGKKSAKTLAALLNGTHVNIDITSVDTGNPMRDQTLKDFFFGKLAKDVAGKISKLDEKAQSFVLSLELNGKHKNIPMHYEASADQVFTATGTIDLMDFGGNAALDSLHKKCEDLHKGADGISKTWSDVNLTFKGKITSSCQ